MEIPSLGRWSDPSLSSHPFHCEPKKATEERTHCPSQEVIGLSNHPYTPDAEQEGCTSSGPKPKERWMERYSQDSEKPPDTKPAGFSRSKGSRGRHPRSKGGPMQKGGEPELQLQGVWGWGKQLTARGMPSWMDSGPLYRREQVP
uniref:Uncharacterized protein n=1 Tax=Molossus molossus TaxID=27622 RepID=A0A7J8C971_MOLMO|nr:hypothetical protein HJG59_010002 [Molossus molossus]